MSLAATMLVGLAVDTAVGWPARIYRQVGHPVTWLGALIDRCDSGFNQGSRTRRIGAGAVAVAVVVAAAAVPAFLLERLLPGGAAGVVLGGLLAWPLIATRSLHDHVAAVAHPLSAGDLSAARREVAMIVGRDPRQLDAAGVARAAMESLAENSSDGVVAPVFWGLLLGLPGLAAYKAVNTLDSMIGHRSPRHEAFGKPAARLDDAVNWIPARLTGLIFVVAAGRAAPAAFRVMLRDARNHRSPNAGWPEAAMAGALGVRLSGPRAYADHSVDEPWLNAGAPDPTPDDLAAALALFRRMVALFALALIGLWLL